MEVSTYKETYKIKENTHKLERTPRYNGKLLFKKSKKALK
jgi:hypothetical protein